MTRLRRHLLRHPVTAMLLLAVAMLMKLAVPVGYMPASSGGFALELCPGYAPMPRAVSQGAGHHGAAAEHGGGHHDENGAPGAKADMPCAFAGLSAPVLGPAGAAASLPVVLAVEGATLPLPMAGPLSRPHHLRPPLRGPPFLA